MNIISITPYFLLFLLMPLFHRGVYVESKILILCSIISYAVYAYKYGLGYWLKKNYYEWLFLLSLMLYLIVCSTFHLIHSDDMGTVRAFLYGFIFLLCSPKIELSNNAFAKITSFGGLLLGIPVLIEYSQGIPRAGGYLNSVIFAQVALIMLCCSLFSFFLHGISRGGRFLSLFGSCVLVACVIYSGTRGAWIVLPIYIFVFLFFFIKEFSENKKVLFLSLLVFISLLSVALISSKHMLEQRYEQMRNDISAYNHDDENRSSTSVGGRFYIWNASIKIIEQHPMLGIGVKGFRPYIDKLAEQGLIDKDKQGFIHSHNEFIYSFVTKGVFGFISYLILYISPLYIVYKLRCRDRGADEQFSGIRLLIILLCVSYGVLALSDVPLKYPVNIFPYSLVIYLMISKLSIRD